MSAVAIARTDAHEGPVYVPEEDALYFTTQRHGERVDIRRLSIADGNVETVRPDANVANGMALAADGALVVCEQGTRRTRAAITRVSRADGCAETIVDSWEGRPLNSPNDVVVKSDGTIWFTDPTYGHLQGFRPPPRAGEHVYRHDPSTGETIMVANGFYKPNGLAFSPGERVLYVADNGDRHHHIRAFDVIGGEWLAHERVFAVSDPGYPDGLKVAADGTVFAVGRDRIQMFAPHGDQVGELAAPGAVNFAFFGDHLLVTADDVIWAVPIPR